MAIHTEKENDVVIVAMEGEINVTNANGVREALTKLLAQGERKFLIDFKLVDFVDSSGLAVLIEMVQKLSKVNGKLRVFNVKSKIREIFEIVKIHKLISIHDDRAAALKDF